MGVSPAYLPDNSSMVQHSFDASLQVVNDDLGQAPSYPTSWSPYQQAVFNLGGHILIEFCPDVSYPISAASWASGVVTLTTSVTNTVTVGDTIAVSGISPSGYNGIFGVNSIIDNQHFTYARQPLTTQQSQFLVGVPTTGPATNVTGATVSEVYFTTARTQFKIASFQPGFVTSAGDQGTSAGFIVPDFVKKLTLYDLQLTKTPFGRTYLQIAQKYGPTIWGLT